MRDAVLYTVFSDHLFFGAVAVFVVATIAGCFSQRSSWKRVSGFLALLSVPIAVIAAPPLPVAVAIASLVAAIAYLALRGRRIMGAVAVIAALGAAAWELPYLLRRGDVPKPERVFVIGDSLASSDFGRETPWPERIGQRTGIPVVNLALASADTAMALEREVPQLSKPASPAECVIVEIGGNDMLDRTDHARYEQALESILRVAREAGSVVMLEIPVLPGRWAYGATQRRLARKYRCALVPRRILAKVLFEGGNTSDRIHLTQRGHDALANELVTWLGWSAAAASPAPPPVRAPAPPPSSPEKKEIYIDSVVAANPLIVKGRARTFENALSLRVRDAAGVAIFEDHTMSVGEMGNHNPYEAELWLIRDPGPRATVEAWEYSAKDGSVRSLATKAIAMPGERMKIALSFAGSDCTKIVDVTRQVPKTISVARLLVEALVAGPTEAEKVSGASHPFPRGSEVRSVILRDGVVTVDFSERLQNVGGSCAAIAIRTSVTATLKKLPAVRRVVITAGGREDVALQP